MSNKFYELELNKYKNVICCFDNDEQGKKFDLKVKEIFPNATIQKSISKDFNDDLVNHKKNLKEPEIENILDRLKMKLDTETVKPKLAFGKKHNKGLKLWL